MPCLSGNALHLHTLIAHTHTIPSTCAEMQPFGCPWWRRLIAQQMYNNNPAYPLIRPALLSRAEKLGTCPLTLAGPVFDGWID